MDSALADIGLPLALAIIMLGLGLTLTVDDFRNVRHHPKAMVVALVCQVVILPVVCFGLVLAFDLRPELAVGMMLLAAAPGGSTANLFSHLFRGDVALNISLTAINSILAIVTLPLVTNFAISYFSDADDSVSLQFTKVLEVFAVVLIPVALGMVVRAKNEGFALRMDRPVRVASSVLLVVMILGILLGERGNATEYARTVGPITALFCALCIATGYYVPKLFGVKERQAVACSFEIGIHNATLAMYVANNALGNAEIAIPGAVYGLTMFFIAAGWGLLLTRVLQKEPQTA